ncbi:FAD:protein FMN transferase [Desulfosarcina ovata]|uniref:FAD:protein FMN transferase n=1 Tax=Desulfosarcina ovata subsp. ovata TaxID=2752305 RepID=A0A5K8ADB0_9BACT|nr:FAD:protein FMN transferase [Desulfosarcina ovata]BBO89984.1 FAD:protein FMN transferase [Desulfosarcina ovata subsp. ovata]
MLNFYPSKAKRTVALMAVLLILLVCASCQPRREVRLTGKTMGTTYHITVVAGLLTSTGTLQKKIDARLAAINRSMSTYDPNSEISRFNAIASVEETFSPSADFLDVLEVASELYRLTDGAWDGTLDPLINLWGFGRKGAVHQVPADDRIVQALCHVGFDRIERDPSGRMRKTDPAVTLDLASIAKGYGVDAVARLLGDEGLTDFVVEIGGEVYARGHRKDGKPWRIGINRPDRDAAFNEVYKAVPLTDQAMATSGDYRIFFQIGEHAYAHILDPRTGRPVTNGVVSASVVAANCTVADGLATALMVMGPEKGVALVDRLPGVACLIVTRQPDGSLKDHPSSGFVLH